MEIQSFGLGQPVKTDSPEILGGKGAGLVWMSSKGVPVPPGFVIPTTVWQDFKKKPKTVLKTIEKEIAPWLDKMAKHFGYMPLLSVRSGARVSCPGMMDTILNVGLDQTNEQFWRKKLGDDCYTDSLHRLVVMYGSVVKGIQRQSLESLSLNDALGLYQEKTGEPFPMAKAQILGSVEAVFGSWDNERAKFYRKMNNIPDEWGTACVIQAMVFGNLNDQSGTGVLFTRDLDSGLAKIKGEFLIKAQGEDVVAGIRTPMALEQMSDWDDVVYQELQKTVLKLEAERKDVQDVEFTIQDGKLYVLQTRNAKRSAKAAIKIALDMIAEGMLEVKEAVTRVKAKDLDLALTPTIDPAFKGKEFATGIGACSGVVTGVAVFSAADAVKHKGKCILVTEETTPDDIVGMDAALGVLTMQGGSTSHAAVVARGMNKPCVVGLGKKVGVFQSGGSGATISIDGETGRVWFGQVPVVAPDKTLLKQWMDAVFAGLKTHQIIHDVPEFDLEFAWMPVKDLMATPLLLAEKVHLTSKKVKRLILDFKSGLDAQDTFLRQLGAERIKPLVVKYLNEIQTQNEIQVYGLEGTKFPVLGGLSNLEELVMAQSMVVLDPEATKLSPAMQKVLGWKKAEGVSMVAVGVIGAAEVNFASLEQVMQFAG